MKRPKHVVVEKSYVKIP